MVNAGARNVIKANIVNNVVPIRSKIADMPIATETTKGIIRIATEQEAKEGVIHNAAITPFTLMQTIQDYVDESTKEKIDEIIANLSQLSEQLNELTAETKDTALCWYPFNHDDWQEDNGVFTCVIPEIEASTGAFRDDENGNKIYVFSVDVSIDENNNATLTAFEPFDGYLLGVYKTGSYKGEDEDDNQFTDEELEAIRIQNWDVW